MCYSKIEKITTTEFKNKTIFLDYTVHFYKRITLTGLVKLDKNCQFEGAIKLSRNEKVTELFWDKKKSFSFLCSAFSINQYENCYGNILLYFLFIMIWLGQIVNETFRSLKSVIIFFLMDLYFFINFGTYFNYKFIHVLYVFTNVSVQNTSTGFKNWC